jgi:hypothetical protein
MTRKDLTLILVPVGLLVGYYILKGTKIIPKTPAGAQTPETIRSGSLNTLIGNLITPVTTLVSGALSGFQSLFTVAPATVVPNYLQSQSADIGGFFAPSDFAATYVPSIFDGAIDYSDASWGGMLQNF